MEPLEDQLKSLGLGHESRRTHADKPKISKGGPAKQPLTEVSGASRDSLLLELPRLGKVARLSEERGFGHLACDGVTEHAFFHVRGRHPRKGAMGELPAEGALVVLIMGSDVASSMSQ